MQTLETTWEEHLAEMAEANRRRLEFIRAGLTENGGAFNGERLTYLISRNPRANRDQYPWRVTTFGEENGRLVPYGHTEHEFLDLAEDRGPYYRSAVWEILYEVKIPEEVCAL